MSLQSTSQFDLVYKLSGFFNGYFAKPNGVEYSSSVINPTFSMLANLIRFNKLLILAIVFQIVISCFIT